ncbi:MAG TPA: hypothetical protein PL193_15865 [Xanthobacteraceae bacterium]|nr:hypothetical protein [Xanthobacteraceae bacterium]
MNFDLNSAWAGLFFPRWLRVILVALVVGFTGAVSLEVFAHFSGQHRQPQAHRTELFATIASPQRVGRMEEAPAYLTCANTIEYYRRRKTTAELDPRLIRNIIRRRSNSVNHAATVGPFLICVLEHNPLNVCDRDNRALAIEGVNRYLQATDAIRTHAESRPDWTIPVKTGEVLRQRERILTMIKEHARDGRLQRRDFGLNQHTEIAHIFETTQKSGDRCMKR